jgi:hypothetical protein
MLYWRVERGTENPFRPQLPFPGTTNESLDSNNREARDSMHCQITNRPWKVTFLVPKGRGFFTYRYLNHVKIHGRLCGSFG